MALASCLPLSFRQSIEFYREKLAEAQQRGWPGDHREQLVGNENVASRAGIDPLDKGETGLWRAVVAHAIEEACGGRSHGLSGTNRDRAMDAARSWFERAGKDFRLVCDLAGLDAQAVRARAARAARTEKSTSA